MVVDVIRYRDPYLGGRFQRFWPHMSCSQDVVRRSNGYQTSCSCQFKPRSIPVFEYCEQSDSSIADIANYLQLQFLRALEAVSDFIQVHWPSVSGFLSHITIGLSGGWTNSPQFFASARYTSATCSAITPSSASARFVSTT